MRTPEDRIVATELRRRAAEDGGLDVAYVYTRQAPPDGPRPPGRIRADDLVAVRAAGLRADAPDVCGPTPLVEAVAGLLVASGHDPDRIRTERFGGS